MEARKEEMRRKGARKTRNKKNKSKNKKIKERRILHKDENCEFVITNFGHDLSYWLLLICFDPI